MDSILDTIKKMLGIESDYTIFDIDIITLINSCLSTLAQVGVKSYTITSRSDTWDQILEDRTDLEFIKEYVYLRVKLVFDPPSTSFSLNALKSYVDELLWRISIQTSSLEVVNNE